jgi:hypothetical protein
MLIDGRVYWGIGIRRVDEEHDKRGIHTFLRMQTGFIYVSER